MIKNIIKITAGFIGLVASCIGIYAFFSGYQSLSSAVNNAPDQVTDPEISFSNLLISPTPYPAIDPEISPSLLFPDSDDVNKDWEMTEDILLSNEEMAKSYADPAAQFLLIESWERVAGQYRSYEHVSKCDFKDGVQFMRFAVSVFRTEEGTVSATEWLADSAAQDAASQTQADDVGDVTYITWAEDVNTCSPPDNTRSVAVRFRQYNVLINVFLSSVKDSVSDDDLLESAMWFAKRIELKIVANARK